MPRFPEISETEQIIHQSIHSLFSVLRPEAAQRAEAQLMQVLWTIITLFIYLICSQIPLYGSLRWRIFRFSASTLFENHGIVVGSDVRGRSISRAYYQRTRSARSREEKHRRGTESSSESNFWRSSSSAKVIKE